MMSIGLAALSLTLVASSPGSADPRSAPAGATQFGRSVVLLGNQALIGEPTGGTGRVHLYRRVGASWQAAGALVASDLPEDGNFGRAMAAEGTTLLVGLLADSSRGGVRVYHRSAAGEWAEAGSLPGTRSVRSQFGAALAINGDWAFVGAPGVGTGAVHIFRRSAGNWTEVGTLAVDSLATGDRFGTTLSLDGDLLAVSAPGRTTNKGVIHLFRRTTDNQWTQVAVVAARRAPVNARLGTSLLLSGGTVWAGAPTANSFQGMVVGFRQGPSGEWAEFTTLTPFEAGPMEFGASLAQAGDELWIGAPRSNDREGRVYRAAFDADGRSTGMTKLGAPGLETGSMFGAEIVVDGAQAAVGMPADAGGLGTVIFLARSAAGQWTTQASVYPKAESPYAAVTGGERICGDSGTVDQFECGNTGLLSFLPIDDIGGGRGTRLNDNWGWTDSRTGREYALVGRSDGTSFVDVSDPTRPRYLGNLPKTAGSPASVWRDMKVYRDHIFVVADNAGEHGVQVFDLTRLRDVRTPQTFTMDAHYTGIASAHNIVMNEESGFAYAVGVSAGGETCGGGLHMIDVRNPKQPTFAGCFSDPQTGSRGTGYSHDAQCVIYRGPDAKYQGREICVGANENAISIADVTDKAAPIAVSRASYPDVAYAHQAWLTDDHRYLYLGDELDETGGKGEAGKGTRTLVWDLADLGDPILVKQHVGERKATDHNLYVKGNRMYQANYTSGLRILDISDPVNPREVGYFDTVPGEDTPQMAGAWSNYPFFKSGTIVVTSVGEGLFLVRDRTQVVP